MQINHCRVESDSQREIGVQEEDGVNGAREAVNTGWEERTILRDVFK